MHLLKVIHERSLGINLSNVNGRFVEEVHINFSFLLTNTPMHILFMIYSFPFGFDADAHVVWIIRKEETIQSVQGSFRNNPAVDLMRMSPCGEYKRTGN